MIASRVGGRIVQVGRLGRRTVDIDLDELARKQISLIGVTFRTRNDDDIAEVVRRAMDDLERHLEQIRPRVERTYPLGELTDALADLESDQHVGKLVVRP
jgi:NADPH:quinone reductase